MTLAEDVVKMERRSLELESVNIPVEYSDACIDAGLSIGERSTVVYERPR